MKAQKKQIGMGMNTETNSSLQDSSTKSRFKPLVATSLALALGVSIASAETIGGNDSSGSNGTASGDKYFVVNSNTLTAGQLGTLTRGSNGVDVVWTNDTGSIIDLGKTSTTTVSAKGVVVEYKDTNLINGLTNTLCINNTITKGITQNASVINFIDSTFIGNILSQQNNSGTTNTPHTFSGNGTYNAGIANTTFALVGDLIGNNDQSNATFNFTNGANMKGRIYSSYNTQGNGQITVTFSNDTNNTTGNTLIGSIGMIPTDKLQRDLGFGTVNVTFNNTATIKSEQGTGEDYVMVIKPLSGTGTNTLTLKNGGTITGKIFTQTGNGVLATNRIILAGGDTTYTGQVYSEYQGQAVFEVQSGATLTLNGDFTAYKGTNIIKLAGGTLNTFERNIFVNVGGKHYIVGKNGGNGSLQVGKSDKTNTITVQYDGGNQNGNFAGVYITDYDSTTSGTNGFAQTPTSITGASLTLNLDKIIFSGSTGAYSTTQGQTFVADYTTGSADITSIDQKNYTGATSGGNTLVLRFRDSASGSSSIDLGGDIKTGGKGNTLLQAKAINLSGNVSSNLGGTTYLWGNAINLQAGKKVLADENEAKVVFVADGTNALIKADQVNVDRTGRVYFLANQGGSYASGTGIIGSDNSTQTTFYLNGSGGYGNAAIYITDYDSMTGNAGFIKDTDNITPINSNASFDLKTTSISFKSKNGDKVGQSFVLDYNTGTTVIDSGTATQGINYVANETEGHSIILRYRNKASSSITIGKEDGVNDGTGKKVLNGNIASIGEKSQLWLEAGNVNVYGKVSTSGTTTINATNLKVANTIETTAGTATINAQTINVTNEIYSIGGGITITGSDATGANSLTTTAIYGNGIYTNKGNFSLTYDHGGSLTTALIAGNKWDYVGNERDSTYIHSISIDNSSATSKNVLISVIDSSSNELKVVGGRLSGTSLVNERQRTITLDGNVALFTNTVNSKNTINVKSGASSTAHIVGDIITIAGENTVALSAATSATGQAPAIIGNLRTDGGNTNISLENALWAPSSLTSMPTGTGDQALLKSYVGTYGTGEITTNGGRTTLVSRLATDLVKTLDDAHPLVFKVNANGGESNIIMQIASTINLNTQAIINYANGVTNMVFANSNDGVSSIVGGTGAGGSPTETFGVDDTDSSINKFFGLTYQDGVKFKLENQVVKFGNESVSLVDKYGAQFRALNENGDVLTITSNRTSTTDTGIFTGLAMGEITSLTKSANNVSTKTYNNTLKTGSAFVGSIALDSTTSSTLEMQANTKLILTGDKATMATLTLSGNQNTFDHNQLQLETLGQTNNRVINLATNGGSASAVATRENFRLLEIGSSGSKTTGLLGGADETIVFTTYVNTGAGANAKLGGNAVDASKSGYAYADRIIIHNVSANATNGTPTAKTDGSVYMQFAVDANTNLGAIKYNDTLNSDSKGGTAVEGNVAVLTVANSKADGTAKDALIKLGTQDTLQGFDVLSGTIKGVATDVNGMTDNTNQGAYTTYFLTSLSTTGADSSIQDATASAFATSLDIFMANFNSLNKRMGELRDNNNSQGAWARVFGGSQSSSFGLGSKTDYVTTQAGYDYAFGFEGANNYLGVAIAYGYSSSSTSNATNTLNGASEGIEGDLKSNMVEVALYNSYVQDSGWYNDTIFKFDYIMNSFNTSGTAMGNTVDTNTFGIILSDEFGYRFKLGSENEWYIDPQAEFSFGYVNGTEYTLVSGHSTLQAKSDSMMQLRSRFGSSFGYDFKKFTENKPIKASVYVGAFYEYDYLSGGDVTLTTNLGGVNSVQSSLASDGRVVMNVGTNMTIKDNTRIYFDFESSFAGKINTDYQVNVGVRYSFGENTGYTPMTAKREVAPLKVSEEKAEESKEAPAENADTQAQEKTTESNTQEQKAQ